MGVEIRNETGLPDELVNTHVLKEVARWTESVITKPGSNKPSIFNRQAYIAPDSPYSQFLVAREAVKNDDIVSGVCEVTTALTFQGIKWEGENADEVDVFNQISGDLDLDDFVRTWFKEDYTFSQAVVGMWWGTKEYKVRGYSVTPATPHKLPDPNTGLPTFQPQHDEETGKPKKPTKTKKKKKYNLRVPVGLTFLDPMKVIPISPSLFGRDRLVWQSTPGEMELYDRVMNGEQIDPVMEKFFLGQYVPDRDEEKELTKWGVDVKHLLMLNPDYVFRIAPTRVSYERFADLRLRSVFPLLDLKQQLIEADRVALVGQANYILLIKIGEKDNPGQQTELAAMREGVHRLAKVPMLIGDHRLNIEIITPDQQFSLDDKRYGTLDQRILNRCFGAMTIDDSAEGAISSRTVARVLEGKRHALKRELEDHISKAIIEANPDSLKGEAPNLTFMPRNVQLDSDSQIVQAVMALRTQKEISRETILEFFGFDQSVEAQRREFEDESGLDEIFQTTVPFSADGSSPQTDGAQGGRPVGGGQSAQSPQSKTKPKTASGNKKV